MTAIGVSAPRSDAEAKVRGEAEFGSDLAVPGMLHAVLVRSPVPAGTIRGIDTSAAEALEGVLDVVTGADVPGHRSGMMVHDLPVLASDYVAYEGEPVAVVLAQTRALAAEAAGLVVLDLDETEPVATPAQALAPGARLVHPGWESFGVTGGAEFGRHGNVAAEMLSDPGDVEAAFEQADLVVEGTYRTPRQFQAYLEPRMALATYEGGRYTVHVSHQFPFRLRDRIAHMLEVSPAAVRIVGHHIGGGFGAKLDVGLEAIAAFLARRSGRPVKMVNAPDEERLTAPCRDNAEITVRSALRFDGTILAQDVDVVFDTGAAANTGPAHASVPLFMFGSIYRVGTVRVRARNVYTNTAPTGAFRGVNGPYLVFAAERHMDEIANALGRDRREFRLASLAADGDPMRNGQRLEELSILAEAFDRVEEVAPWAGQAKGPLRGVGIAAAVWLTNPAPGQATVKLNEDGSATVVTSATDNGSGAVTTGLRQIAAEGLGLPAERVWVTMPDTDATGYDAGSQGSRTTHVAGRAVHDATVEVRRQVVEKAAGLLEAAAEDLVIQDGQVHVAGVPSTSVTLAQVAMAATFSVGPIAASASYTTPTPPHDPLCATGLMMPAWPTPTYHVHQAEVEIDPVTGHVTVLRYVVAQETGRVINPDATMGQVQGGVVQGLGYALWERMEIDNARFVHRTYEAAGLPLASDVPTVEAILMEHAEEAGPYGAKGVAEPPIVPVAAVIACAVADAVGSPIDSLPITPEAVLIAIEDGRLIAIEDGRLTALEAGA